MSNGTFIWMLIAALFVNAWSGINPKSVGEWTSKLHPYMDYYSTTKQSKLYECNNVGGFQGHYGKWKEPTTKVYMLYDSVYITSLIWQNNSDRDGSVILRRYRELRWECGYTEVAEEFLWNVGPVLCLVCGGGSHKPIRGVKFQEVLYKWVHLKTAEIQIKSVA